jgi:hypothetical protein
MPTRSRPKMTRRPLRVNVGSRKKTPNENRPVKVKEVRQIRLPNGSVLTQVVPQTPTPRPRRLSPLRSPPKLDPLNPNVAALVLGTLTRQITKLMKNYPGTTRNQAVRDVVRMSQGLIANTYRPHSATRSRSRSRSPKGCLPGKKCTRVAPTSGAPARKRTIANRLKGLFGISSSGKVVPNFLKI